MSVVSDSGVSNLSNDIPTTGAATGTATSSLSSVSDVVSALTPATVGVGAIAALVAATKSKSIAASLLQVAGVVSTASGLLDKVSPATALGQISSTSVKDSLGQLISPLGNAFSSASENTPGIPPSNSPNVPDFSQTPVYPPICSIALGDYVDPAFPASDAEPPSSADVSLSKNPTADDYAKYYGKVSPKPSPKLNIAKVDVQSIEGDSTKYQTPDKLVSFSNRLKNVIVSLEGCDYKQFWDVYQTTVGYGFNVESKYVQNRISEIMKLSRSSSIIDIPQENRAAVQPIFDDILKAEMDDLHIFLANMLSDTPMSQCMHDSLISIGYNAGKGAIGGASSMVKLMQNKDYLASANLIVFNQGKPFAYYNASQNRVLENRRRIERALFCTDDFKDYSVR